MAEYGIFNDEGCLDRGYISLEDAASFLATEPAYFGEGAYAAELCPDHADDEQPREECEECAADGAGDDETNGDDEADDPEEL